MRVGRIKQFMMATGGSVLIAAATLAVVPTVAGASLQPTSTTVTAKPASTTTGHPLTLTAQVVAVSGVASTVRAVTSNVPTGTVTFTITGLHAGTASCKNSNVVTITHHGKAKCHVLAGQLLAADSPYTVHAAYSGDTSFAASSGTTSVTVAKAKTHTKLKVGPSKPVSQSPNAVTATVTTARGTLSGSVLFSVSASPNTPKGKRICTNGGDLQPLAVSGNVGTAVCDLAAGWFRVPAPTTKTPHPHGSWNVTANYSGDGNYLVSVGTKSGTSKV